MNPKMTKAELIAALEEAEKRIARLEQESGAVNPGQSEAHYRTLIETLDVSLCRWKPDNSLTFGNEKYRETFGIQGSAEGILWTDFLPEEARASTIAFYREVMENPRVVTYEHPVMAKDGSERHYQWIDSPIYDAKGALVEFQSVGIDITERRQSENLVQAQRDLARIIGSVTTSQEAWAQCLDIALRVSGMDSGGFYLFDENYQVLELIHHQGLGADFAEHVSRYAVDSPNAQMVLGGKLLYMTEADLDTERHQKAEGLRSLAVIPITHQNQVLGCMNIGSHHFPQVGGFTRQALESVATEIGSVIIFMRTEMTLRRNRQILLKAQAIANLGSWTADLQAGTYDASPEGARLVGWTPGIHTADELMDIIHPDDREYMQSSWAAAMQGAPYDIEHRIIRNGEIHWLHITAKITFDGDGKPISALGITQDITERKRAEEALRESNETAQAILNAATESVFLMDTSGRVLAANETTAKRLGRAMDDLIGANMYDLIPPHLSESRRRYIDIVCRERKEAHFEDERNGIWFENNLYPIVDNDGQVRRIAVYGRDVTERKQMENKIQANQARLHQALESARAGIWEWDLVTGENIWSDETWPLYGLEWQGEKPSYELWRNSIHPDDREMAAQTVMEAAHKETELNVEYRVFHSEGTVQWLMSRGTPVRDEHGKAVRYIGTIIDITERKQMEEALRESEERFRALFESNNAIMMLINPDTGAIVDANPTASEFYGYPNEQLITMNIADINQLSAKEIGAEMQQAKQEERNYFVFPHRLADGQIRTVEVRTHPIKTRDKTLLFSIVYDITERMQTEEKLHAVNERFNALFYNAPLQAIIYRLIRNDQGRIIDWEVSDVNPLGAASTGISAEEMIGKSATALFGSEVMEPYLERSRRVSANGEAELFETNFEINERSYLASVFMIGRDHYANVSVDITERKRAEEALKAEQTRFEQVAVTVPGAICTILLRPDGSLCMPYATRVFEEIYGIPLSSVAESIDAIIEKIPPEQVTLLSESLKLSAAALQPWRNEYLYHHPQKGDVWLEGFSMPIREADGSTIWHGFTTDITERKQAENALRESQIRVELALNGANAGMWDWNIQTGETVFNERWANILGYTLQELEPISIQTWADLCHPDDLHISERLLEKHFAGETDYYEFEVRMKHKNGSWAWVLDRGRVMEWDADGKPIRMFGTHMDVTERKQAEIALRASEEKYRGLMDSLDSVISTTDYEGRLLFLNDLAAEQLGSTVEKLTGKTMNELFPAEMAAEQLDMVQTVIREDRSRIYESQSVGMRGIPRWYRTSIQPIHDESGHVQYALINATDIDDLKTAQQELIDLNRTLEERVRQRAAEVQDLYDNAPAGYHSLDGNGVINMVNQTQLKWMGYTREEVLGHSFMDFLSPESASSFREKFPAFIQQGSVHDLEFELLRSDGTILPVLINATAIYDENKEYLISRSTVFDHTERKAVEEAMRHANLELERALRMKDEFLANMSHELRTPLNAILGLSESMIEQVAGPVNDKQNRYLNTINESGRHLLELINDILDLAKVEAGQVTLSVTSVDVLAICESSLRMIKQLAHKKNQSVEASIEKGIGFVQADERRLKQMIVNLLSNAVKFTPQEGRLGLIARVDREEGKLSITVWDNGIGISARDLERLFQPFVQVDSGLSRETSGTGLGLALVAQMARLHGGGVSVESQPNEGSRFTIVLPWRSAEPPTNRATTVHQAPEISPLAATNNENGRVILVVEDTEHFVMLLKDYLEEIGFRVESAKNGVEGVAMAISLKPDLILMDVMMPGMDGLTATKLIRQQESLRKTPVIALTALAMSNDRESCLAAGMNDYISKPINMKELVRLIKIHLPDSV